MPHAHRSLARLAVFAFFLMLATAPVLAGGPPWIAVEAPVDPLNRAAPGAAMLVHVYSCGEPSDSPVD